MLVKWLWPIYLFYGLPGQFRWAKINVIFDWNQSNLLVCNLNALPREAAGELCSAKITDRDFNRVDTDYGYTVDWNRFTAFFTLTVSMSTPAFFAGLQRDDTVSFIWQDEASSIILPWKPRLANPPLPVPVAALPNDAQIDTAAPPFFPPLFCLHLCEGAERTVPLLPPLPSDASQPLRIPD